MQQFERKEKQADTAKKMCEFPMHYMFMWICDIFIYIQSALHLSPLLLFDLRLLTFSLSLSLCRCAYVFHIPSND